MKHKDMSHHLELIPSSSVIYDLILLIHDLIIIIRKARVLQALQPSFGRGTEVTSENSRAWFTRNNLSLNLKGVENTKYD